MNQWQQFKESDIRRADWSYKVIEEVLEPIIDFRGRTPKKLGLDWGGGDIPALSALNVKNNGIDFSRTKHFGSNELYEKWMTRGEAAEGDVIMTTEAPLGNVAQIPDNRKYILSQRVVLLKPKADFLNSRFLYWNLRSPSFQEKLRINETGATATGIRMKTFKKLKIPIPSFSEQERIVSVLDEANDSVQGLKDSFLSKLAGLEELKQSVLEKAFAGELTDSMLEEAGV